MSISSVFVCRILRFEDRCLVRDSFLTASPVFSFSLSLHLGGNNVIQSERMSERANKRPPLIGLLRYRVTPLLATVISAEYQL